MLFDLDGPLRKTSVPASRPLLPVFEAVANKPSGSAKVGWSPHTQQAVRRNTAKEPFGLFRQSGRNPRAPSLTSNVAEPG